MHHKAFIILFLVCPYLIIQEHVWKFTYNLYCLYGQFSLILMLMQRNSEVKMIKLFNLYIKQFLQGLNELPTETKSSIFYASKFKESQSWIHCSTYTYNFMWLSQISLKWNYCSGNIRFLILIEHLLSYSTMKMFIQNTKKLSPTF